MSEASVKSKQPTNEQSTSDPLPQGPDNGLTYRCYYRPPPAKTSPAEQRQRKSEGGTIKESHSWLLVVFPKHLICRHCRGDQILINFHPSVSYRCRRLHWLTIPICDLRLLARFLYNCQSVVPSPPPHCVYICVMEPHEYLYTQAASEQRLTLWGIK